MEKEIERIKSEGHVIVGSDGIRITPEKMTLIINLKMMFEKLGNTDSDKFEQLEKISIEDLNLMQTGIAKDFNMKIRNREADQWNSI